MNPSQLGSSRPSSRNAAASEAASVQYSQESGLTYGSPPAMDASWTTSHISPARSQMHRPRTPDNHVPGRRRVSSPGVARRRHGQEPSPSRQPQPEHQWTLFGQLMEVEGQLSSSPRPTSIRESVYRASNSRARRDLSPTSTIQSATTVVRNVQTPLGDSHLGSGYFPSPRPPFERRFSQDAFAGAPDYDSDDSDSTTPAIPHSDAQQRSWSFRSPCIRIPTLPFVYRQIVKCVIAYFVASLFTFSPHLSGLFSNLVSYGPGKNTPLPSGHMVATIAVYFAPAKTVGAMIEADLFCLMGLFYAAFVSLGSVAMYWWLELKPGWEWLADAIVLVWIGFSMGVLAFLKVWMHNPSFNTACSMMAIIIFVVIVREGGLHTLVQVSAVVVCGALISTLVCYFVWPQSATSNLQANMIKTLDSFSTVLNMLTNVFLLDDGDGIRNQNAGKLQQAVENHQNSFTSLKKNLAEAQSEWIYRDFNVDDDDDDISIKGSSLLRNEFASHRGYEDAVDIMNRLAQHLNGLRSGTRLQHELTKAGLAHSKNAFGKGKAAEDDDSAILNAAAELFGDLVEELGPPLKSLSGACTYTFRKLKAAFTKAQNQAHHPQDMLQPEDFAELAENIERALLRFESTSNHALLRLYRSSATYSTSSRAVSPIGVRGGSSHQPHTQFENTILTEDENEHVFLVYFFIFTLQEFAGELISLVDAMERIYNFERRRMLQGPFWIRVYSSAVRKATLIRLWFKKPSDGPRRPTGIRRTLSYMIPQHRFAHPFFPKVRPHAPDTIQTPSRDRLSFSGRILHRLWELGKILKERNAKYAIKVGIALALMASPAFFDATRPFFMEYQGDWALVSTFIVISPTIGATNYLSLQRVLGTLSGAAVAAAMYTLFPEDAVVLSIFGLLFSIPCFYIAVATPKYLSASRFVLLTYNLTCLYCYNLRQKDVSVVDIAVDRALSVGAGVLWAFIVSRLWWPSEARRELSKALGEFCLNIGWLYTRLVASNSFAPEYHPDAGSHENQPEGSSLVGSRSVQITKLHNSIHEFMAMELHLQIKLIELQNLLAQAQHEPRLKGPFPVQLYRNILASLQTILDRLHSMRCVTTKEEWYTSVRKDFIVPVNKERHEMVGNIILSFSTLASAFRLKAPLPPYLPPAEKSRQRLVAAIRRLDVVKNRDIKGSRQLLFFAYAITMKGVTEELEKLGKILQEAFGVIGESSEAFDSLFLEAEEIIEHVS